MEHIDQSVNPDWHEKRRRGIFATDVGPILRMSRFGKGPLDIAVEKICGVRTGKSNVSMSLGKKLEPVIGQLWTEETGSQLRQPDTGYHPQRAWMGANADFICDDGVLLNRGPMIVEAKANSDRHGWGEPHTDQVPADILLQVQWQLACYDLQYAEVAALFSLSEFERYYIERNDKLISACIEICGEFWERCQRSEFPSYSWDDPRTNSLVPLMYRPDGKTVIQLGTDAQTLADEIETLAETENTVKKLRETKRSQLHELMGTAAVGLLPNGTQEVRRSIVTIKAHHVEASTQNRLSICKVAKNRKVTP